MNTVPVITANDLAFKKWRWWSDWIDVCVFEDSCRTHLLQMRVSRSNAKQFAVRTMTPIYRNLFITRVDGLVQMPKAVSAGGSL